MVVASVTDAGFVVLTLVFGVATYRNFTVSLRAEGDVLVVRNVFRTRRVERSEVLAVVAPWDPPGLGYALLVLRGGGSVRVLALSQVLAWRRSPDLVSAVAALRAWVALADTADAAATADAASAAGEVGEVGVVAPPAPRVLVSAARSWLWGLAVGALPTVVVVWGVVWGGRPGWMQSVGVLWAVSWARLRPAGSMLHGSLGLPGAPEVAVFMLVRRPGLSMAIAREAGLPGFVGVVLLTGWWLALPLSVVGIVLAPGL